MATKSFELPASFNGEVRLFPLPDLVMFPSNALPLHIFESRYREMFEDAMHGDQLVTMATLMPGFENEYYSRPAISPFVCISQVTAHERTEKGTYNLVLIGLQRARIEHEIEPVRSYRRARVELFHDQSLDVMSDTGRKTGEQLAGRISQAIPSAEKLAAGFLKGKISLESLTDIIAFHLSLPIETKLQLLGEADVLRRASLLLLKLTPAKKEGGEKRRFPTDFSAN